MTETDVGGELTVDHFQPASAGGDDSPGNLIYCCPRCNQYKADYFPKSDHDPRLWNPRQEERSRHLVVLMDGVLLPLTSTGEFTLRRLRLNRPPLVAHRLRRGGGAALPEQFADLVALLEQLLRQQTELQEQQQALLQDHRYLLKRLLEHP